MANELLVSDEKKEAFTKILFKRYNQWQDIRFGSTNGLFQFPIIAKNESSEWKYCHFVKIIFHGLFSIVTCRTRRS